jgi:hypothetical protein
VGFETTLCLVNQTLLFTKGVKEYVDLALQWLLLQFEGRTMRLALASAELETLLLCLIKVFSADRK